MSRPELPPLPCLCGSFRRTTRALTQLYEDALRPLGLRATQFTILQVLQRAGELSQGQLGDILAMDSTSLTRTLEVMRREGWIAERRGDDRRWRFLSLAPEGWARLDAAEPVWQKLQSRLRRQFGPETWDQILQLTHEVANVAQKKGEER